MVNIKYPHKITVAGLPGGGKSTLGKSIAKRLGYPYFNVGSILRRMADKAGISLVEMSRLAEKNHEIDREIDNTLLSYAQEHDKVVIDGRLAAWMLFREGIGAFHIYVDASLAVRTARIAQRDGISLEQAVKNVKIRQNSEKLRYKQEYDIDINDLSVYDLVINSENNSPKQLESLVFEKLVN